MVEANDEQVSKVALSASQRKQEEARKESYPKALIESIPASKDELALNK